MTHMDVGNAENAEAIICSCASRSHLLRGQKKTGVSDSRFSQTLNVAGKNNRQRQPAV